MNFRVLAVTAAFLVLVLPVQADHYGFQDCPGGTNNPVDTDDDGDGLTDSAETDVYHTNPCDDDTDGDGLSDSEEVNTHGTNPNLADSDSDGLTDAEEINDWGTDPNDSDSDDDGLIDGAELATHNTDPLDDDSDDDTLLDGAEVNTHGTDPLDDDSDDDTLLDGAEVNTHGTNPNASDTDSDGLTDPQEINTHGTNPNASDTDSDGLLDGAEVNTHSTDPNDSDSDDDLLWDGNEITEGTDPNDADSDGDGFLLDGYEVHGGKLVVQSWGTVDFPSDHSVKQSVAASGTTLVVAGSKWGFIDLNGDWIDGNTATGISGVAAVSAVAGAPNHFVIGTAANLYRLIVSTGTASTEAIAGTWSFTGGPPLELAAHDEHGVIYTTGSGVRADDATGANLGHCSGSSTRVMGFGPDGTPYGRTLSSGDLWDIWEIDSPCSYLTTLLFPSEIPARYPKGEPEQFRVGTWHGDHSTVAWLNYNTNAMAHNSLQFTECSSISISFPTNAWDRRSVVRGNDNGIFWVVDSEQISGATYHLRSIEQVRIWGPSDPLSLDSDGDGHSDVAESFYGSAHPLDADCYPGMHATLSIDTYFDATGTQTGASWGEWSATPGQQDVGSNYVRLQATNGNFDVSVAFQADVFTGPGGAEIPIDGNIRFWIGTGATPATASWTDLGIDADGSRVIDVPAGTSWLQYEIDLPSPLPEGTYSAPLTLTEL